MKEDWGKKNTVSELRGKLGEYSVLETQEKCV